jgi:sec-independent protein translocase protein TatA
MDIGPGEALIAVLVLLLVFGSSRIPQLARNLGRAKAELQKGLAGEHDAEVTDDREAVSPN